MVFPDINEFKKNLAIVEGRVPLGSRHSILAEEGIVPLNPIAPGAVTGSMSQVEIEIPDCLSHLEDEALNTLIAQALEKGVEEDRLFTVAVEEGLEGVRKLGLQVEEPIELPEAFDAYSDEQVDAFFEAAEKLGIPARDFVALVEHDGPELLKEFVDPLTVAALGAGAYAHHKLTQNSPRRTKDKAKALRNKIDIERSKATLHKLKQDRHDRGEFTPGEHAMRLAGHGPKSKAEKDAEAKKDSEGKSLKGWKPKEKKAKTPESKPEKAPEKEPESKAPETKEPEKKEPEKAPEKEAEKPAAKEPEKTPLELKPQFLKKGTKEQRDKKAALLRKGRDAARAERREKATAATQGKASEKEAEKPAAKEPEKAPPELKPQFLKKGTKEERSAKAKEKRKELEGKRSERREKTAAKAKASEKGPRVIGSRKPKTAEGSSTDSNEGKPSVTPKEAPKEAPKVKSARKSIKKVSKAKAAPKAMKKEPTAKVPKVKEPKGSRASRRAASGAVVKGE